MNRIYKKLKDDERFKDKLKFNESKNCLTITFHDYLWLEYFEGNCTSACDEGLINLCGSYKNFAAHWHITEDDEALKTIIEYANEDNVYIENTSPKFFSSSLRMMKKEKFEKKKEKYMTKNFLRIYSVDSIIKRSEQDD